MKGTWRNYRLLAAIIGGIAAVNLVFLFYSPDDLVRAIGVENSYLVLFLIAALGGLSSFTSSVYYAAIATFSAGGSIPWLLGIAGGFGLAVSDTIFFFLARKGRDSAGLDSLPWVKRAMERIERWPRFVQYLVIYLYLGFTPLPNDFLMVALAVLGFSYWSIIGFVLAGGITVTMLIAYLGNLWH